MLSLVVLALLALVLPTLARLGLKEAVDRLRAPKAYVNNQTRVEDNVYARAEDSKTSSFYTPVFKNANASSFTVNSSALPLVNFALQPSWAGRLPISGSKTESRARLFFFYSHVRLTPLQELFFWYWPSSESTASDTLTIWYGRIY
jgi:carboxypeptidase D